MTDEIKPVDEKTQEPQPVVVEPVKVVPLPDVVKGPYKTGSGDAPQIGLGTTLTITPPSTMSLTPLTVVKVVSIKPPSYASKDVKVTGMSDSMETYIPGVPDYSEGEIDVLYMHSQQSTLNSLCNQQGTGFAVGLPGGGSRTWAGYINNLGEEIPVDNKLQCKLKCRAQTTVTFT